MRKKAIIIGGTSGIGKALTHVLLENDYQVAITGIERDLVEELQSKGHENLRV